MMTERPIELKACPFCGRVPNMIDLGEAAARVGGTGSGRYYVLCSRCKIEQGRLYAVRKSAATAWNRRTE